MDAAISQQVWIEQQLPQPLTDFQTLHYETMALPLP
jgi:hypothetical protein